MASDQSQLYRCRQHDDDQTTTTTTTTTILWQTFDYSKSIGGYLISFDDDEIIQCAIGRHIASHIVRRPRPIFSLGVTLLMMEVCVRLNVCVIAPIIGHFAFASHFHNNTIFLRLPKLRLCIPPPPRIRCEIDR